MTLMTASADKPTTFVDDYLLYQLASASQVLSDEFHRKVKASGTKIHVWRVLACVVDQPGLMLTSLSKLVLYEQSRLTKIIDQMVDDGLVNKQPVAGDRRKMAIFVTAKGQDLVAPLMVSAKAHESKVLENLTDSEMTMLKRVLNKLCNLQT
ncbi:MAG: MarR family winged helix-turn-helix transcriptional regulator [Rhodobacteraceae bacterium]|nr:MarR family winged helix-turn-helix transcriptional regulator [Paracoccaceae bacterium]